MRRIVTPSAASTTINTTPAMAVRREFASVLAVWPFASPTESAPATTNGGGVSGTNRSCPVPNLHDSEPDEILAEPLRCAYRPVARSTGRAMARRRPIRDGRHSSRALPAFPTGAAVTPVGLFPAPGVAARGGPGSTARRAAHRARRGRGSSPAGVWLALADRAGGAVEHRPM